MSSGRPRRSSGAIFDMRDLLGCFAVEEQIGRRWARSHSVHGDFAAAEFLGEDIGQSFDRRLRGGVGRVTRQRESDDTR